MYDSFGNSDTYCLKATYIIIIVHACSVKLGGSEGRRYFDGRGGREEYILTGGGKGGREIPCGGGGGREDNHLRGKAII